MAAGSACQPYADAPQKSDGLLGALSIERAPWANVEPRIRFLIVAAWSASRCEAKSMEADLASCPTSHVLRNCRAEHEGERA